jgi:hypothetical protein
MIAIFKKELETVDVFGALRPVSDVFEREHHRIGISSKSFGAQPRLIPFATLAALPSMSLIPFVPFLSDHLFQ